MRALLVYNPNATTTDGAVTDAIAERLDDELKLDVEATKRRDHASYLAAGAAHEGYEVVFALGGDGTVNEIMQGLAKTPVKLAIIPGGSTNVWARTFGLPGDPLAATEVLLRRLDAHSDVVVNLGTANGRYFGFNCGFGFDAEVVRLVEERHRLKRTVRQASFLWCGALAVAGGYGRRANDIRVEARGHEPVGGLRSVACSNSDPYTYLGPWPARVCPDAGLTNGLDVAALGRFSVPAVTRFALSALRGRDVGALDHVSTWHDLDAYELKSATPLPLQLDGDYIGLHSLVSLRSVPRALTVVA